MEPDITERVFSGTLANLPELESTVVRVFLSSTFTDFQVERNWVMKHAVPILRKFCQERGLDFQTFLGDKYGFRPFPSEIEAAEFKLLKNMAMKLGHDTSLLLSWYKCDYNKEPTVYSLQPISSQFPHYFDMTPANATQRQNAQREWWSTVDKLTALLRQSASAVHKEGKLSEREKHKYFQSGRFTDLMDKQIDREAEELREKVRLHHIPRVTPQDLLFRYNVPWDENVGVGTKNEDQVRESLSARHRTPLFEEVVHHLHFVRTKCETFCGREDLIQKVQEKAQEVFKEERSYRFQETYDNPDGVMGGFIEEQKKIKKEHDGFAARLEEMGIKYVAGDRLMDLESDPTFNPKVVQLKIPPHAEFCRPVIVVGKSGSGKTALMAKLAEVSQSWYASKDPVFMVRFLGTSTMSTTIREVLFGLCEQIWQVYKIQIPSGIDFDADYQYLTKYFAALLWKIDVMEKPLTIVLDSVDQLNQTDHAHMLNWLPQKLPKNVTFLISLVTDRTNCFRNLQLVFPFSERFIEMNELQNDVVTDVIMMMNKKYSRHLSKKQKNMIFDQFANCSQPLYLKLLVDMSLSWRSYTDVNQSLLGATIKEAINHLEKSWGNIAYLCAAREGLSEVELEDLLSLDDEDTYIYHLPPDPDVIRLPPLLWKRIQYDITEYVVERQSGGKKVIGWYHRQFSEAARERYLHDGIRKKAHAAVAEYFQVLSQLGPDYSGNAHIETLVQRCVKWCGSSPLPLLVPSRECVSKPSGNQLYSIGVEVANHEKNNRDQSSQCLYLHEDVGQLFVARPRTGGLSDLLCVYDLRDHGSCIVEQTISRYIRGISFVGQNKYLLLEVYQLGFKADFGYNKTIFIYQMEKTLQEKHIFRGIEEEVDALLISPDETLLISASETWRMKTEEVLVFSLKSMQKLFAVPGTYFAPCLVTNTNLLISRKAGYEESGKLMVGKAQADHTEPCSNAVIFGNDRLYYAYTVMKRYDIIIFFAGYVGKPLDNAIVWDLKTILENFTADLKLLEMEAVQTSLQTNGGDGKVELEDYVTKYLAASAEVKPQTTTLALNRSGESVYVGTESGKVQVYDIESGKPSLAIETNIGAVMNMMMSQDGRCMIVAGSRDIHVEDLHSQRQTTLEGRGKFSCMAEARETLRDFQLIYSFQCVAINSSGTKVLASIFEFPIIVNIENEKSQPMCDMKTTDSTMGGAVSCAISLDDQMGAMSSTDGAVRVINMNGKYLFRFQQKSSATTVAFSKDGVNLLSAGYRTIYVWSIVDGDCKAISIATFQANCEVKAVDIATGGKSVAYIPEGIAELAILRPNNSLQDLLEGKVKPLRLGPQVEAMALTFTSQRKENTGKASKAC
ncbi:NWD2-like protein, partial [Mya arenaria]